MATDEGRDLDAGVELDAVLEAFPACGRYHFLAVLLLTLACVSSSVFTLNFVFGMESVNYRCKNESIGYNYTCGAPGAGGAACAEWVYDDPNSFVAEFQLACQEWKRTMVGTVRSLGNMVGLLLVGPMSDRLGRKLSLVITGVSGGLIGVSKTFVRMYWPYLALEALEGAIGDMTSPAFMLSIELLPATKRVPVTIAVSTGYPIGEVLMCFMAWLFPYWRTLFRATYAPSLFLIFYLFLIDESPRWLLSKGKGTEAGDIIKKIARVNKVKIDDTVLKKLTYKKEETTEFVELLKSTFLSKSLRKRFFVCLSWWITCTFVSYGLRINSVSLQGNKYLNFTIMGLIDLPGLVLLTFLLKRFKRRTFLMSTFLVCAALCLAQPFVPKNIIWLSILLFLLGKLTASFFLEMTYLFTSELFPTYTRNSMHAMCSAIGRVGSILAPQTPLLKVYWSGLPSIVFGGMALTAGLLTLLVPDTTEDSLPDNVEQAEAIGRKQKKSNVSKKEECTTGNNSLPNCIEIHQSAVFATDTERTKL